jgi:DHA1 family multidrug resistance protein-like MFS transporter
MSSSELRLPLVTEEDREAEDRAVSRKRWLSLGAVLLCLVVCNTSFSVSAPIYPQEAARHGVGATAVGLIFSSFSFVDFFSSIAFGRLLQRRFISRRATLVTGIVVLAFSTAVFGLVAKLPTRTEFISVCLLLRLIEGIACAAVDTSATAITASLFKGSGYFGTVMGISECMMSLGWIVGPVAGGTLAAAFGFPAPFYFVGGLTLAFTPLAWLSLPVDEPPSRGDARPQTSVQALVTYPPISLLILTAGIAAATLTFGDAILSPHLEAIGFTTTSIGFTFAVYAAIYAVFSPPAGLLSDKVGRFPVICTGLALCGAGCLLLGPLPWLPLPRAGHASVWTSMVVLGVGVALAFTPITPAILQAAEAKAGAAETGLEDLVAGIISGIFYLGCGAGPVVGGALRDVVGFAWTASFFGAIIVAQAVVVTILSTVRHDAAHVSCRGSESDGQRRYGRRMSESHDAVRGYRGGLAAPSADLTSYRSDEDL